MWLECRTSVTRTHTITALLPRVLHNYFFISVRLGFVDGVQVTWTQDITHYTYTPLRYQGGLITICVPQDWSARSAMCNITTRITFTWIRPLDTCLIINRFRFQFTHRPPATKVITKHSKCRFSWGDEHETWPSLCVLTLIVVLPTWPSHNCCNAPLFTWLDCALQCSIDELRSGHWPMQGLLNSGGGCCLTWRSVQM